jgi:hypothetical protein
MQSQSTFRATPIQGESYMSQSPLLASGFTGGTVFRKTQRGYAEIAQETQILHPRLRRFLVFVDGSRSLDKLVEITQVLGDTHAALAELVRDGFVTADAKTGAYTAVQPRAGNISSLPGIPMPSAAPAQPTPVATPQFAQATAPTAPQYNATAPAYPLDQVKNYMLSDLRSRMGKDAELVAPKILAAKSTEELIVMMMRLRDILTKYSGNEDADQFVKKFKDMLI